MPDLPSAADADRMGLTEQERHLYEHHANNLRTGNYVIQPTGQTSTIRQIPVQHNGRWYSVPTIWDGKELKRGDAIRRALSEGSIERWPSAGSEQELQDRYSTLHDMMEADVNQLEILRERRGSYANVPVLSSRHSETYD
jgi:hypothetical protein